MKTMMHKDWIEKYSMDAFEKQYHYDGKDLGVLILESGIQVKCWTPFATSVILHLYQNGSQDRESILQFEMRREEQGTWTVCIDKMYLNHYYDFTVAFGNAIAEHVNDPYAKAVGINGDRGMLIDLSETNPEHWDEDMNPNAGLQDSDVILYELHVRDLSSNDASGIVQKGKYLGVIEEGTRVTDGSIEMCTGLDHIKELGVTHIHFLPFYDYGSIDESQPYRRDVFNWGYDPKNYNVPEGSYATDAEDGRVRIMELKKMIQGIHQKGMSVVMDVVYNHTYHTDYCFNRLVPGFFYRIDADGVYSNGSGCGNDTATERSMVKKFIIDSVEYWAREYHIDGFRFDLMGNLDVDTMNGIRERLDQVRPNILLYGEGWILNTVPTKKDVSMANQKHLGKLNHIAMFSDNMRDCIKGSVFEEDDPGFISGNVEDVSELQRGLMGAPSWAKKPEQVINYTSCHDNYTLFDKIALCNPGISFEDRVRQSKLATAIVMLSQGIPLLHAGEEFLRTKVDRDGTFVSDSYNQGDDVNGIAWGDLLKPEYRAVYHYVQGLIAFRKHTKALHIENVEDVSRYYEFLECPDKALVVCKVTWEQEELVMIFNGENQEEYVELPWENAGFFCYVDNQTAGIKPLYDMEKDVVVSAYTCKVYKRNKG